MKTSDSVWQGSFGYWQSLFIHQNILIIGYTAWDGYINAGRGMVCCQVSVPITPSVDWSLNIVAFERLFVSQSQAQTYLSSLEVEQSAVMALLQAIATYDPTQSIVTLVMGNGDVGIHSLQNLAILPAQAYDQVRQRWSEFQPGLTSSGKTDTPLT